MNRQQDCPRVSSTKSSRREFLAWTGKLATGSALAGSLAPDRAQAETELHQSPSQKAAHDPFGPPIWPPIEKVDAVLQHWARKHPDRMRLDVAGRSAKGRPLYVIRLTDGNIDGADKEHALITALHSGLERSGTTTVLAIIEWLLSEDATAREILRRQVVVGLPVPDPDRYVAGEVSPAYGAWTLDGPLAPERSPESMVVKKVMDEYQPEVHADIHGVNMAFARYIMFENSGASYSNLALRPYHRDIMRQMDEAALAEGYPSDMAEADAERIYGGPNLQSMQPAKLWLGQARPYAAIYCYNHYHTMVSASEVLWERSGLLRHRRLLEIGNETWPGERHRGYPTRVVMANTHQAVTAYGQTAAMRRRSRVELWNNLSQITLGLLDPVVEGKAVCLCATSAAAVKKWLPSASLTTLLNTWRGHPGMDAEAIARFLEGWPAGQNAPQAYFALQGGGAKPGKEDPIQHGLCLRLRLPYRLAKIQDLRLNGRPLAPSDTEGFASWTARACTYIQVNVSPARLRSDDLFVVTCRYDPGEKRGRWDTWRAF